MRWVYNLWNRNTHDYKADCDALIEVHIRTLQEKDSHEKQLTDYLADQAKEINELKLKLIQAESRIHELSTCPICGHHTLQPLTS